MYILIKHFNYETVAYIATQTENSLGVSFLSFFFFLICSNIKDSVIQT